VRSPLHGFRPNSKRRIVAAVQRQPDGADLPASLLESAFQPQFEKSVNGFTELGTHFDLDKIKNMGRPF